MVSRIRIPRKGDKHYKKLVKRALKNSTHTPRWGCLSKNGMLFKISTMRHTKIPAGVIRTLVQKKKLVLKDDGYYKWK
jgi:hypothetical protein